MTMVTASQAYAITANIAFATVASSNDVAHDGSDMPQITVKDGIRTMIYE